MWLLLAVLAQSPVPPVTMAVLPSDVQVANGQEMARLLTGALAERLAHRSGAKVISDEDLQALVAQEQDQQATGCTDQGCFTELAGALGADVLILTQLRRVGEQLVWTVTMMDHRAGAIRSRAAAQAQRAEGLLAQVDDVVLTLLGRGDEVNLEGPAARQRLGFVTEQDHRAFRDWRHGHPALGTDEALTQFVIEKNTESTALAAAELGVFSLAALLAASAGLLGGVGYNLTSLLGFNAFLLSLAAVPLGLAAVGMGVGGLVLLLVDALDLGKVHVRSTGCCRQASEIRRAGEAGGVRKALAFGLLTVGPVAFVASVLGFFSLLVLSANLHTTAAVAAPPPFLTNLLINLVLRVAGQGGAAIFVLVAVMQAVTSLVTLGQMVMPGCFTFGLAAVTVTSGSLLMLWPEPPLLEAGP